MHVSKLEYLALFFIFGRKQFVQQFDLAEISLGISIFADLLADLHNHHVAIVVFVV